MNPRSTHTLDEHGKHKTTDEPTIYHTLDEHGNPLSTTL